ncbi:MAG: hypothetical protein JRI79_02680 [Deltaproteobacteria bacterium]|nr:hypothetical protein [Deltaproteobacteria bacterium]MBW2043893.1 hypothetical protein [Deltaproteobacteria bacterium]MBW2300066.1 hypothetical protein [Deltaproteobacteria bacterium]
MRHRVSRGLIVLLVASCFIALSPLIAHAQGFGLSPSNAQPEPQFRVLSSSGGRYVFGQISDSSKDQFMLDTLTGRLWRIAESGEIGIYLRPVPYRDRKGKCYFVPQGEPGTEKSKDGKESK